MVLGAWGTASADNDDMAVADAGAAADFDPALLSGGMATRIDLSRFRRGNPLTRGTYLVDLHLNKEWLGRREVVIGGSPPDVCFPAALLQQLPLASESLTLQGQQLLGIGEGAARSATGNATPPKTGAEHSSGNCPRFRALVKVGQIAFSMNELRLDISIPQANLRRLPRGHIDPQNLQPGVSAALLAYNLNLYRSSLPGLTTNSAFLGLNAGLNLGRWRMRHIGNFASNNGQAGYSAGSMQASRTITPLGSVLTVGDTYTSGQLLQSVLLRGITLGSDERMTPPSRRGYAPVIRGTASSNARVDITQNGQLLYNTNVPPGPFEIDDIYPLGMGGDLVVSITEANGARYSWTVSAAAAPQLLREGATRYALAAGLTRGYAQQHPVVQATFQRGLSNVVTFNADAQTTRGYAQALLGGAFNTPWGAVQGGLKLSRFGHAGQSLLGHALDASWAQALPASGTSLTATAYRSSSVNFLSFDEAMRTRDVESLATPVARPSRTHSRLSASLNQRLSNGLSISLSGNRQTDWFSGTGRTTFQVGVARQIAGAQLSLNLTRSLAVGTGIPQTQLTLGLMLPLEESRLSTLTSSYMRDSAGRGAQQLGASSVFGQDSQWAVTANTLRVDGQATSSASINHRSRAMNLGGSVSVGPDALQQTFMASGGLVVADGALISAATLGDTIGVVHADGGEGLRVASLLHSTLDSQGYAIVPNLTPFAVNTVDLDMTSSSLGLQFESTSATVTPYGGSVILMRFKPVPGYSVQLRPRTAGNKRLPFGAAVLDEAGNPVGNVGQGGRLSIRLVELTAVLTVSWGSGTDENCRISLDLKPPPHRTDVITAPDVACIPQKETTK